MTPLRLSTIANMIGARVLGQDVVVDTLVTDSRALPAAGQALFVALQGERFDGHDYVAEAARHGAVAALVARALEVSIPEIVVADTERALAALAQGMQAGRKTRVCAITGSNGKTSVKTLLLAVLEQAGSAYASPGNRNNEIGLPLAVIDAPDEAQFAIYEMGAGKPGDIAYLTAIVQPWVALVNNVAPAHLERMGSLLTIADTKAALYDALPADGVAVINADDAFAPYFAARAGARRQIRFGLEASAEVGARDIRLEADGARFVLTTPIGEAEATLALPGRHNVRNALAAASMALALGLDLEVIVAGLACARPAPGRLVRHALGNGAVLIDDSYNANPGSLDAAIEVLTAGEGKRWLVLGDMRELGGDAAALHARAGRRAKAAGVDRLYAYGPLSMQAVQAFGMGARSFDSHAAIVDALNQDIGAGVRILVKGSRGSAMERVVEQLLEQEAMDAA